MQATSTKLLKLHSTDLDNNEDSNNNSINTDKAFTPFLGKPPAHSNPRLKEGIEHDKNC